MKILIAAALTIPCALAAQTTHATLPGSSTIDDSRIKPREWELTMTFKRNGQEMKGGSTRYQLVALPNNTWAYITTTTSQLGIATDTSIAKRGTLQPISHRSHAVPRKLFLDYAGTQVNGSYAPTDSAPRSIARTTDVPTFDAAMLDVVLGSLPLAEGFQTRLPMYIEERGGLVWFDVAVAGKITVESVHAWDIRVKLPGYTTQWVLATDDRRVLAGRVEYANGAVVEMTRK